MRAPEAGPASSAGGDYNHLTQRLFLIKEHGMQFILGLNLTFNMKLMGFIEFLKMVGCLETMNGASGILA